MFGHKDNDDQTTVDEAAVQEPTADAAQATATADPPPQDDAASDAADSPIHDASTDNEGSPSPFMSSPSAPPNAPDIIRPVDDSVGSDDSSTSDGASSSSFEEPGTLPKVDPSSSDDSSNDDSNDAAVPDISGGSPQGMGSDSNDDTHMTSPAAEDTTLPTPSSPVEPPQPPPGAADDTPSDDDDDNSSVDAAATDDTGSATDEAPPEASAEATVPEVDQDKLAGLKQEAIDHLEPLADHLDQNPLEEFRTTMMRIQANDNHTLLDRALSAAKRIEDDKERAQAMLDIINEINYFSQAPLVESESADQP